MAELAHHLAIRAAPSAAALRAPAPAKGRGIHPRSEGDVQHPRVQPAQRKVDPLLPLSLALEDGLAEHLEGVGLEYLGVG